jgi:predicted MFS family arabinose efflux permease
MSIDPNSDALLLADGAAASAPRGRLGSAQVAMFAAACGLCVANIFYAQPLIGLIAPELGISAGLAGLVVALTQLGYGAGLLFVVPLSDLVENRRLVTAACGAVVIGLLGVALSRSAARFLLACFVVGVSAVATQILVPFASHLAPEASRGKVVGNVMAGLLGGILLARPFASIVAATFGWRAVFFLSAGLMLALMVLLRKALPRRQPSADLAYLGVLRSLPKLVAHTALLRRRAFYQGMLFAGFNLFWTASPLLLVKEYGANHREIAMFTLAGAAGALSAPIAGRLADRGLTRPATGGAIAVAIFAFGLAMVGQRLHSVTFLVIAALLLDAAVQVCQVLSLRSLYMLAPELRGRLNGLFIAFAFLCGASASALAAAVYTIRGWNAVAALGGCLAAAAFVFYLGEFGLKGRPRP